MRAIIVREYGPYQDEAKLEYIPKPEAPGAGDVLIRNKAAGVSFATSLNIAGNINGSRRCPLFPARKLVVLLML